MECENLFTWQGQVKIYKLGNDFTCEAEMLQQISRKIPVALQEAAGKEIIRLFGEGKIEREHHLKNVVFITPTVITVNKDCTMKTAMDIRCLSEQITKDIINISPEDSLDLVAEHSDKTKDTLSGLHH